MREMSVAEQRYKAVLAVISDGPTVTEVGVVGGVPSDVAHAVRAVRGRRVGGVGRPVAPAAFVSDLMGAAEQVAVLETRRRHPGWGPRRIVHELAKADLVVSESGEYRALRRSGLIEPGRRRREQRDCVSD
jgi:hypothetical protein